MGLFDKLRGKLSMEDPVHGSAQVVSATGYHGRGAYANCRMQLVVQGEGVEPTAVGFHGLVHNRRWPSAGMVLPVTVDRANPQSFRIEWDEVEHSGDRARRSAEGLAAAMRGEGDAGALGGLGGIQGANVVNLSGRDLSQLSDEQKAKLRMLGVDPDALAAGQGPVPSPQPAAPSDDDGEEVDEQLARLERLAALRDQGVLTDDEFQAQKQRILDSD